MSIHEDPAFEEIKTFKLFYHQKIILTEIDLICRCRSQTSVICLINKIMLDVLYRSRERLDQPEFYHIVLKTYILQNITTSKIMFSRSQMNDPV